MYYTMCVSTSDQLFIRILCNTLFSQSSLLSKYHLHVSIKMIANIIFSSSIIILHRFCSLILLSHFPLSARIEANDFPFSSIFFFLFSYLQTFDSTIPKTSMHRDRDADKQTFISESRVSQTVKCSRNS